MVRVLVSACLLGDPVRYNGKSALVEHEVLVRWQSEARVVACCPELAGGFSVPRLPAEIPGGDGLAVWAGTARVADANGRDITAAFREGAERALEMAKALGVRAAILTDGSPSCGTSYVFDGTFSGRTRSGLGVTASLLQAHGIAVFSQFQIADAAEYVESLEGLTRPAQRLPAHGQ